MYIYTWPTLSCAECPGLDISFKLLGRTYGPYRGELVYADVDNVPRVAQMSNVTKVPSFLMIKKGQPIGELLINPTPQVLWKTVETEMRQY